MKYKKLPVEIDAIQWTGLNLEEVATFLVDTLPEGHEDPDIAHIESSHELVIPTLEGDHKASSGDWIIRGIAGELYPCKPEIFEATYERAEDTPNDAHDPAAPDEAPAPVAEAPPEASTEPTCGYSWASDDATTTYSCELEPGHGGDHRAGNVTFEAPA